MKKFFIILFFMLCALTCYSQNNNEYTEDNAAYWYLKAFEEVPRFASRDLRTIENIYSKEDYNKLNPNIKTKLEAFDVKKFLQTIEKAKQAPKHCYYNISDGLNKNKNIFFPSLYMENSVIALSGIAWKSLCQKRNDEAAKIYIACLDFTCDILQPDTTTLPIVSASKMTYGLLSGINRAKYDNTNSEFVKMVLKAIQTSHDNFAKIDRKKIVENTYNLIAKNIEFLDKSPEELTRYSTLHKEEENDDIASCRTNRKRLSEAYDKYRANDEPDYSEKDILKATQVFIEKDYLLLKNKNDLKHYTCPLNGSFTIELSKYFPTEIKCSCLDNIYQQSLADSPNEEKKYRDYYIKNIYTSEKNELIKYFKDNISLDHYRNYTIQDATKDTDRFMDLFNNSEIASELISENYRYNNFLLKLNQCLIAFDKALKVK